MRKSVHVLGLLAAFCSLGTAVSAVPSEPASGWTVVTGAIVTTDCDYVRSDFVGNVFNVQMPGHAGGLLVAVPEETGLAGVRRGDRVDLEGILGVSTFTGETYLSTYSLPLVRQHGEPPRPIFMRTSALGGAALAPGTPDERPGVTKPAGQGTYNKGLLVRIAGRVTHVNYFNRFFYLDDGCLLEDGYGAYGVRVSYDYQDPWGGGEPVQPPDLGSIVVATGICSSEIWQGETIRLVKLRGAEDVQVILGAPQLTAANRKEELWCTQTCQHRSRTTRL